MSRRAWAVVLPAGLLLLVGGCSSQPSVLRVSGAVRYRDKPVPNLFVNFVPEQGRPSWGVTDENGRFELSYDREHKGAVPGKHKVYFEFRPRDPKQDLAMQQGKLKLPPDVTAVLAKYGREKSTLSYDVTRDGQEIDLRLE